MQSGDQDINLTEKEKEGRESTKCVETETESEEGDSSQWEKKRQPLSLEPKVQPRQAQGSELFYMVSAGLGQVDQNQLAWEACMVEDATFPSSTEGGMTEEVIESVWSMDSISRTPRRTLELAVGLGKSLHDFLSIQDPPAIIFQFKNV